MEVIYFRFSCPDYEAECVYFKDLLLKHLTEEPINSSATHPIEVFQGLFIERLQREPTLVVHKCQGLSYIFDTRAITILDFAAEQVHPEAASMYKYDDHDFDEITRSGHYNFVPQGVDFGFVLVLENDFVALQIDMLFSIKIQ